MIRRGTLKDLDDIVQFQINLAKETEDLSLSQEIVRQGVCKVLQNDSKGIYYIWEREEIEGCLLTIPEWSDWRDGTVLWIHSVYVRPESRGQAIFREMYTYLKRKVQSSRGLRGLRLYVDKENKAAQAVYHKLGMSDRHYNLFEWLKPASSADQDNRLNRETDNQKNLEEVLASALPIASRLMFQTPMGFIELRGDDLTMKSSEKSITIFHASAHHSEGMSHAHLRHGTFQFFKVDRSNRGTQFVAFLENEFDQPSESNFRIYLNAPWTMEESGALTVTYRYLR